MFVNASLGQDYYFEATPNIGNLIETGVSHCWNGFVLNRPLAEIVMGFERLDRVSDINCGLVLSETDVSCNYNLNTSRGVERIRLKVRLSTEAKDIRLLYTETSVVSSLPRPLPSPTCPIKKGCDGEPDT